MVRLSECQQSQHAGGNRADADVLVFRGGLALRAMYADPVSDLAGGKQNHGNQRTEKHQAEVNQRVQSLFGHNEYQQ